MTKNRVRSLINRVLHKAGGGAHASQPVSTSQDIPFIARNPGERVRILFLLQFAGSWASWKSVYEACRADPCVEAHVVLIERTYADARLKLFNDARQFLIENDIPFIHDEALSLGAYRPHLVFMQSPYHDTLPQKYHLDCLRALGARVAYIPYGIEIGGGATNLQYQFNLPLHRTAWRIFARSERHQRMYAKYCEAGSAHVVCSGSPRLDVYANVSPLEESLRARIKGRKLFLWNPHFSVEQGGWSTFLQHHETMLATFAQHADAFLIIRPHPLLFTTLKARGGWRDEDIARFKATIASHENMYLDDAPDYLSRLAAADAIFTDAGSFLLEFFASGKPVVYLHAKDGPGLNDDGDVTAHLYVAQDREALVRHARMLLAGEDPAKGARLQAMPDYFMTSENGAGEYIKNHIVEHIDAAGVCLNAASTESAETLAAERYWTSASTTYLAPESYYQAQEERLAEILKTIGRVDSAIDIGCGDGRYTRLISEHANFTKAIDVSERFIGEARKNLEGKNVALSVESITHAQSCQTYDLVVCMGVTSGLIAHSVFLRALDVLVASCRAGGFILMKDSLAIATEQPIAAPNGYRAVYRNLEDYRACFLTRGLSLVQEIELGADPAQGRVNKFFLFRKPDDER